MTVHPTMMQALAPFTKTMRQTLVDQGRERRAIDNDPRPLTLKEMTAHIRKRIAAEGIKARVRMSLGAVQVFVPEHGLEFTHEEQRAIRRIAVCNGLTKIQGIPIDVERMTDPCIFNFYMKA